MAGGLISDRKGVDVPDVTVPIPASTDKDRRDLSSALSLGVDWVALSFVQQVSDVLEARELIGNRAGIMSKIEKLAALNQLEGIIRASDAVMVARGDLGVDLPAERVPPVQKRILRIAYKHGKPVVVATQMLESMMSAESQEPGRGLLRLSIDRYDVANEVQVLRSNLTRAWRPWEALKVYLAHAIRRLAAKGNQLP